MAPSGTILQPRKAWRSVVTQPSTWPLRSHSWVKSWSSTMISSGRRCCTRACNAPMAQVAMLSALMAIAMRSSSRVPPGALGANSCKSRSRPARSSRNCLVCLSSNCPAGVGRTLRAMKTMVLGAGIIGISTAWQLLERGHEVTVVERQPDAALETSFANAGQISVSYCEPWATRSAPLKALKWMFDKEAPLLLRPQLDWQQWRWGLQFLAQCNDAAFERNVAQIVALGAYSHAALKEVVQTTGIEYHRLERGIAHFYTDQKSLDAAGQAVQLMRRHGVQRRLVSRDELLQIEPAFKAYGAHITGGTYTSSDESGDAHVFTQALARRCAARGAQFLYGHEVRQ